MQGKVSQNIPEVTPLDVKQMLDTMDKADLPVVPVKYKLSQICTNVIFGQSRIPTHFGYTLVSMLPLAHVYGLMFELIYPLCGGVCIYFLGKSPSPKILLAAMAEVKPYSVMTVPLVMEKIFDSFQYANVLLLQY